LPGINYYRLKQIDYNGNFSLSDVIALKIGSETEVDYTLFPNPTADKFIIQFLDIFKAEMIALIIDV
jgi:hypothetical protein